MPPRLPPSLAPLLLAALAVTACGKTPQDRLQGRWLGDSIENVPEPQAGAATGWVKGTAIEFAGSKATVTVPTESPRSGAFKVTRAHGETLTVSFQRPEGTRDEATFSFRGEGKLAWELGEGRAVVLVRAAN